MHWPKCDFSGLNFVIKIKMGVRIKLERKEQETEQQTRGWRGDSLRGWELAFSKLR